MAEANSYAALTKAFSGSFPFLPSITDFLKMFIRVKSWIFFKFLLLNSHWIFTCFEKLCSTSDSADLYNL